MNTRCRLGDDLGLEAKLRQLLRDAGCAIELKPVSPGVHARRRDGIGEAQSLGEHATHDVHDRTGNPPPPCGPENDPGATVLDHQQRRLVERGSLTGLDGALVAAEGCGVEETQARRRDPGSETRSEGLRHGDHHAVPVGG